MQKLFLCHFTREDAEVTALAEEMHLRGVPLWLDHEGGFMVGDNTQDEARRVIADSAETFGLLFYATPEAFTRDFINRVELHQAIRRRERDPGYLLMAVPRRMGFDRPARLSLDNLGEDLTLFISRGVQDRDAEGIQALPLRPQFAGIANEVLRHRLASLLSVTSEGETIGLNLCTREHLAPSPDDVLDLDATRLFGPDGHADAWPRLLAGLCDMKRQLRAVVPAPRLRVRGSKHLTAAFLIGRVFPPPTVRELQTQQSGELWSTACPAAQEPPLSISLVGGSAASGAMFVGITATDKSVREGVRRFMQKSHLAPLVWLWAEPVGGPRRGAVADNATACAMALQVRSAILEGVAAYGAKEIHFFAAIPQGLATLIGHHLNATVPVQLYEHDGQDYVPSLRLTHGDVS